MKTVKPIFIGFTAFILSMTLLGWFTPVQQDAGVQGYIFQGATITTTVQTAIVACSQGSGAIGRKTMVVHNDADSDGIITVTAELRDSQAHPNFTSGYLAVNGLAADTAAADTAVATDAAGAFCQVSAVSATTSTITVTLRRE